MVRRKCVYFNSSILIKAVFPSEEGSEEALSFIGEVVRKGYIPVVSAVHLEEKFRPETVRRINGFMKAFGFRLCRVDLVRVQEQAIRFIVSKNVSHSHTYDVMHLLAARECGCRYIAAVDKFIWRHAGEFGLKYINYYTGIP